ncbi:uncharacterized protein NEMAJ01_0274 [Nematocida major]|uniref:uncharacterized protein n=1 Tax=Nematocida major TaxID=1912982 RepID=UPI00200777FE|nr:uncharacterized protein NEMAJ01_0274 [Nematocida major]KAH9385378.1 hypothetical protein NEMAJ01_0274 [Nematocida major]
MDEYDRMRVQRDAILQEFSLMKSAARRVPFPRSTHTSTNYAENIHEYAPSESARLKVISALERDRRNWTCILEQPFPAAENAVKVKDARKPALKRKYIKYVKFAELVGPREEKCSICWCSYKAVNICGIMRCMHMFHRTCINRHISTAGSCPICRRDVISGVVN